MRRSGRHYVRAELQHLNRPPHDRSGDRAMKTTKGAERCPWPFPGPHYDWTTDDELGSIVGQLRQHADHSTGPAAESLRQIAKDVQQVRALLTEHVQLPQAGA